MLTNCMARAKRVLVPRLCLGTHWGHGSAVRSLLNTARAQKQKAEPSGRCVPRQSLGTRSHLSYQPASAKVTQHELIDGQIVAGQEIRHAAAVAETLGAIDECRQRPAVAGQERRAD